MYLRMWDTRNRILHRTMGKGAEVRESAVNSKVRMAYAVKDTFAHTDQVLFEVPLAVRLTQAQRSKNSGLPLLQDTIQQQQHDNGAINKGLLTTFYRNKRQHGQAVVIQTHWKTHQIFYPTDNSSSHLPMGCSEGIN